MGQSELAAWDSSEERVAQSSRVEDVVDEVDNEQEQEEEETFADQLRRTKDASPSSKARSRDMDATRLYLCLLYTSPSPRDKRQSRMPSSA